MIEDITVLLLAIAAFLVSLMALIVMVLGGLHLLRHGWW